MKIFGISALAACLVLAAVPAFAGDPQAGEKLASQSCAACHGKDGVSIAALYPNLCGQKADYLVAQLKALRDGTRPSPIMGPMAKSLSDADIENAAAYFSALRCP